MSITVVTPAPDQLLTSIDAVKLTLDLSGVSKDNLLEDLIRAASDWVSRYCGRTFGKEEVTEKVVGKGVPEILLSRTPIVSISEVLYKGSVQDGVVIQDSQAGIVFLDTGFTSSEISFNTITPHPSSYGREDWSFTYEGGYVLPSWFVTGEERNLPYDLERAVINLVKTSYHKVDIDETLKSYRIGDTTITWANANEAIGTVGASMPGSARDVLNYYRRAF